MAQIQKRRRRRKDGKLGAVAWRVRYVDPDGKLKSKTFATRAAADDFAVETEAAKLKGDYRDPHVGRETLREYYEERWLPAAEHQLKPSTYYLMVGVWKQLVVRALGNRRLASITQGDMRGFVQATLKKVSIYRTETALRLVKSILRSAVEDGLLARSPAERVKAPKRPPHENRYLTHDEVARLVEEMPSRWKAFVLVAAYGGLRFGEIAGLRVHRIDFLRKVVRIEEAIVEVKGYHHRGSTKSGKSRVVTLPGFVIEAISEHLSALPAGPEGLVFTDVRGGPVRRRTFYRAFHEAIQRAGFAPLRFQDLRHTSAAFAIAEGAHPKTIQLRLGHHSAAFTLDVYGGLFEGLDSELAERLEERGRGAGEKHPGRNRSSGGRKGAAPLRRLPTQE